MVALMYNDKEYLIASEYNDLTDSQLIKLAPLLKSISEGDLAISLKVLQILLNKSIASFYFMSLDFRERALEHVQWVFKENTLTKQLLPEIHGFFGPKSNFDNLTLEEYHCCEIFYTEILEGLSTSAIDKLIAVLYRKPKSLFYDHDKDPAGDARKPFNEHEIDYWAKKISKWNPALKDAVLMWYDGCRQHLISLYSSVFTPSTEPSTDQLEVRGMFGVIRQIADGNKYGQFEQVKKLNIHIALLEMEQLLKEAAEADKLSKS